MLILHGGVFRNEFLLWAESSESPFSQESHSLMAGPATPYPLLPFAASTKQLQDALAAEPLVITVPRSKGAQVTVSLPCIDGAPVASSPLVSALPENISELGLQLLPWRVPALRLSRDQMIDLLSFCVDGEVISPGVMIGHDLTLWAKAMQFAATLVARQQFLPGVSITEQGGLAVWEPVFLGEERERLSRFAQAMPQACLAFQESARDGLDDHGKQVDQINQVDRSDQVDQAAAVLTTFLTWVVDSLVRRSVRTGEEGGLPLPAPGTIESETAGLHQRWLTALVGGDPSLAGTQPELAKLAEQIADWRRPLDVASDAPFRLCFYLEEPLVPTSSGDTGGDFEVEVWNENVGGASPLWFIRFLLQSVEDPSVLLPVDSILSDRYCNLELLRGGRVSAREYLYRALGQAARIYPEIERSFAQSLPNGVAVDREGAYRFLSQIAPALKNAGFSVRLPSWWTRKQQLAARIRISSMSSGLLSMDDLIEFDWALALGGSEVSLDELERLAELKIPLVRMRGRWIEFDPGKLQAILKFFRKKKENSATARELVRIGLGGFKLPDGLEFGGITGDGPVVDLVSQLQGKANFEQIEPHKKFKGRLRPYQQRGLSWLWFLRKFKFGACLADDMGLGKTVQMLAFLQKWWYEEGDKPSLLACPTSVLGNWEREVSRFVPELPILTYHGLDRLKGTELVAAAGRQSLVITSYALLGRDIDELKRIDWANIILDEAQNIKNPETQQATAANKLKADFRVALTGTPVENSLADLWSLMNFLNPGYLGSRTEFKERFFVPIQVYQEREKVEQLKQLTGPFILRRLKIDKSIAGDLPDKVEAKTTCHLTKEQATLYAAVVADATGELEHIEGFKRKSLVLATLLQLKQICNHPALYLGDGSKLAGRSGKLRRLLDMVQKILNLNERALIFTQYQKMGAIIQRFLQSSLGQEVLFLHGGTSRTERDRMVERFQTHRDAPGLFLLSLKAGGTGLNLTRANHVIHYDRWWNPAVEDQATDRAFRIGQERNVSVHKFICPGTVEEKIDEMIERKKLIAAQTVGAGDAWLTELSTSELRDVFALRETALVE